jgi:hypothetical protein
LRRSRAKVGARELRDSLRMERHREPSPVSRRQRRGANVRFQVCSQFPSQACDRTSSTKAICRRRPASRALTDQCSAVDLVQ